jgi:hypothetical protein
MPRGAATRTVGARTSSRRRVADTLFRGVCPCPLWVISGHFYAAKPYPIANMRADMVMSAKCQ